VRNRFDAWSERVYADNWGLKASTTELRTIFDLGERFSLWPKVRFHGQSAVRFWQRAYEIGIDANGAHAVPELRTGDRELGALWSLGLGAGIRWNLGEAARPTAWSMTLQWDETDTHFLDALYIRVRTATLVAIGLEAEL